ncbi:MAG: ethanolamine ammonia-lyase reactivating factor EutA [Pseudomonadota bacterium]
MHDIGFDHEHPAPEDAAALSRDIWAADNVEFTTVGIDIGTATSHAMFARVALQRLSSALSSRFVVVRREVLCRSPILLTPYQPDELIDADALARFLERCYAHAGLTRSAIDSGAVILTGEALKRANARSIAELFAEQSGRFVCATAGHHLEGAMAAHGSGAAALSRARRAAILHIDIGGGTTKFVVVDQGEIAASAAIAVGGRLIVEDEAGRIERIAEPALAIARRLGIEPRVGGALAPVERDQLIDAMAQCVIGAALGEDGGSIPWVTAPLAARPVATVTFSGGVAEYLYGRERARFGDIGFELAERLRAALAEQRLAAPVLDPGQGIRATVIGAAQFSVQVSGNTIQVADPQLLPLRNLPVAHCCFELGPTLASGAVAAEVRAALARIDRADDEGPVALAFAWRGDPSHARLHALAAGIAAALARTIAAGLPLVLLVDGDVAQTLGRVLRHEIAPAAALVALDGVQLRQFDYVDLAAVVRPTNVVPVVIKSLLF